VMEEPAFWPCCPLGFTSLLTASVFSYLCSTRSPLLDSGLVEIWNIASHCRSENIINAIQKAFNIQNSFLQTVAQPWRQIWELWRSCFRILAHLCKQEPISGPLFIFSH
jgi:hypothetical protein